MNDQWDFVIAAYAVTAVGTMAVLFHSYIAMRRAERRARMVCADAITDVKPKQQRLILAVVAFVAVIGAGLLASFALRDQAAYFFTPAEAKAATITPGDEVRLGGMVERGSIERQADGLTIAFRLTDGTAAVPVRYTGIVPDLFAEGSGAVADGRFRADGTFMADRILAKHDERYMAPQMDHIPLDAGDTVIESDPA